MAKYRVVEKSNLDSYTDVAAAQKRAIVLAEKSSQRTYEVVQVLGEAKALRATFSPHVDADAITEGRDLDIESEDDQ